MNYDFTGLYNMVAQNGLNQQNQAIEGQELNDIAAANQAQSGALNTAALAGTRRRAGGTTFRRRGTATSANQLVSGLGVANAKALADKRKALAKKNMFNNISIVGGAPIPL